MKKVVILLTVVLLTCTISFTAVAETEQNTGRTSGSIGDFLTNAWNDAGKWVENAWNDASKWVNGAWGDASKWVEGAWNDSSTWVSGIWGDASTWVSDTVGTWWVNTFNTVTENKKDTWEWIDEKADALKAQGADVVARAKNAISAKGDNAEQQVKDTIKELLTKLGLNATDAEKVWETIVAYAEEKSISPIDAAKLSIPYILQLCSDSAAQSDGNIPAVAVAQYLTGIIEKLGIGDKGNADEMINSLVTAISGF